VSTEQEQRERASVKAVEIVLEGGAFVDNVCCGGTCGHEVSLFAPSDSWTENEVYIILTGACHECWAETLP
jgi:hypothetical protein